LQDSNFRNVYGSITHPIYIYVPGFVEESAGIRSLHYLCHALNMSGHPAWLVIHGTILDSQVTVSGYLNTPTLTQEISNTHHKFGLVPIVIYPETIPGNPLNAQVVVRFLMNFTGVLGGATHFPQNEICVAFSKKIAEQYDTKIPVLFIPPIDIREVLEFKVSGEDSHNGPVLFYAAKYRGFIGKPELPKWTMKYSPIELIREGVHKHSRSELLKLISDSCGLIVFENSSVITEATILGTPVLLVKSEFFDELIAEEELGSIGTNWNGEVHSFEEIEVNPDQALNLYLDTINKFEKDLEGLVANWKITAADSDYLSPIVVPNYDVLLSRHRIAMAAQIIKNLGFKAFFRVLKSFIRRRVSYAFHR
jgi:hypothetical protein